jgi:hypothetical protein
VRKAGAQSTPVTKIDGKVVIGFDEAGLRDALGL